MSSVFIAFMGMKFIFRSPYSGIFTNINFEKLLCCINKFFFLYSEDTCSLSPGLHCGFLCVVFFGKSLVILILLVLYIMCLFLSKCFKTVSLSLIFSNFIMLFFVVFFLFLPIAWEYLSFLGMSVQFSSNVLF